MGGREAVAHRPASVPMNPPTHTLGGRPEHLRPATPVSGPERPRTHSAVTPRVCVVASLNRPGVTETTDPAEAVTVGRRVDRRDRRLS